MKKKYFLFFVCILLMSISCDRPVTTTNKHWILLTLDTLRQSHLGHYGHPDVKSPMLDFLAKKGFQFTEATSESSWTLPSHASLMTSQYPRTHGATYQYRHFDNHLKTAAEILAGHNYKCGAVVAATPTSSSRGFNRGFHHFDDTDIEPIRLAEVISELTCQWLNGEKSTSIFFWAHFFDPHPPYNPPFPYNRMYDPVIDNEFDMYFKWNPNIPPRLRYIQQQRPKKWGISITSEIVERGLSLYCGEITYMDRAIENIIRTLHEKGLYNQSIITFVADHGEYFGERNHFFKHAVDLGEPLIQVPCIMKIPSLPSGRIIQNKIQLVDILPTILSLLHITTSDYDFSGTDFKQLLTINKPHRHYTLSELHLHKGIDRYAIKSNDMKCVFFNNKGIEKVFLYDLSSYDENNNLAELYPEKVDYFRKLYQKWKSDTQKYKPEKPFHESYEMQMQMKALGYIE